MFIVPLGDDVDHRDFPIAGVLLTMLNVTVFVYMLRLAFGNPDPMVSVDFWCAWGSRFFYVPFVFFIWS